MNLKFILSAALAGGTVFAGFADGYTDGVEYFQAGQYENAEIVLNQTLNDPTTDKAVAYYYLGSIALQKGDKAKANEYYELGLQANPEYPFNYIGKGELALKNNNKENAEDLFKQAEKIDKKDGAIKIGIARAFYSTDSVLFKKDIEKYLKDAKKKDKEDPTIYIFEGDRFADQKEYGKSASYYEMAILYDADRPVPYVKYANTYFHIVPKVAIEKLKEIVDKNPNSALGQRELAEKYYENNQWTLAAQQYKNVIDNPNHFPSDEIRYTQLLYFGERYDESIAMANQLLAKNTALFPMKRMLFLNYAALKNFPEAEKYAEEFFQMKEDEVYTFTSNDYATYGTVLLELEKDSLAVNAYEKAIQISPDKKELYIDLSAAYSALASQNRDGATYAKAADAYEQYINKGEYGNGYDLNDLFVLTGKYQNVIATATDTVAKTAAYDKVMKHMDFILEKQPNDYRIWQRKARIIRIYNGEDNKTQAAVDAYLKTIDVVNADADVQADRKNSVLEEAYIYIGTYYLINLKDTPTAKSYFEKAYAINPTDAMRNYIDGLK